MIDYQNDMSRVEQLLQDIEKLKEENHFLKEEIRRLNARLTGLNSINNQVNINSPLVDYYINRYLEIHNYVLNARISILDEDIKKTENNYEELTSREDMLEEIAKRNQDLTIQIEELNEKIKGAFAKSDDPHLQERGHSETYCCYYHAPTLVIVSNEPTRWWAPMDCACALQNIFLAAKSLGIGSCWINQLGQTCDDPDVRAFLTRLGIPENHRVYGCAALGYAPADAPVKEKNLAAGTVTVIR